MDLPPRALGPNSILPWNQPIASPFDKSSTVLFNKSHFHSEQYNLL